MKNWNRKHVIAGVTALVLALSTAAFAQHGAGKRNPERMLDRQMSVMKEQLKLTPDQETKVRSILEDNGKKMRELMKQQRTQMKALREETHSQLSTVLGADQLEQWKKFQAERGHRFRKGGNAPPKE